MHRILDWQINRTTDWEVQKTTDWQIQRIPDGQICTQDISLAELVLLQDINLNFSNCPFNILLMLKLSGYANMVTFEFHLSFPKMNEDLSLLLKSVFICS